MQYDCRIPELKRRTDKREDIDFFMTVKPKLDTLQLEKKLIHFFNTVKGRLSKLFPVISDLLCMFKSKCIMYIYIYITIIECYKLLSV